MTNCQICTFFRYARILTFIVSIGVIPSLANDLSGPKILQIYQKEGYIVNGENVEVFEDTTGSLELKDLLDKPGTFNFFKGANPVTRHKKSNYWIRFQIQRMDNDHHKWLLEILDSRQNLVQLYELIDGVYKVNTAGFSNEFNNRQYEHKNFVFDIYPDSQPKYYYLKANSNVVTSLLIKLSTSKQLMEYALNEYFYLGLFYGVIIIMSVYSFFIFIAIRQKIYLLYALYILSWLFSSLCTDNMGIQYFWRQFPGISLFGFYFSKFILLSFFIFYSIEFLNLKDNLNWYKKLLYLYIPFYLIVYTCYLMFNFNTAVVQLLFLVPFAFVFFISLKAYKEGFKPSIYFFVGNSMVLFSLVIFFFFGLGMLNFILTSYISKIIAIYISNVAIVLEISIFSFGMADRLRFLKKEKEDALNLFVEQLKENQKITERAKKELEEKVIEIQRQKSIIENKSNELDLFLYKSSHNLKGPVKSILGLSNLGVQALDPDSANQCFSYINQSAKGLDKDLDNLRFIFEINSYKANFTLLSLNEYITSVKAVEKRLLNIQIPEKIDLITDRYLFDLLFKNILQSLSKLTDPSSSSLNISKIESNLSISIGFKASNSEVSLIDKAFEAFNIDLNYLYNINLELYIAKICANKLDGTISLLNAEENRMEFKILLPVQQQMVYYS